MYFYYLLYTKYPKYDKIQQKKTYQLNHRSYSLHL